LGALGPKATLDRLWNKFDGRGRVCQNGDAGGPDHQNLFMRARQSGQIESFGEFLLATMAASIAARGSADPDDVGDDLNFIVYLAASRMWRSTKTSETTIREYVRTRPVNYGCYLERYRKRFNTLLQHDDMVKQIEQIMSEYPEP